MQKNVTVDAAELGRIKAASLEIKKLNEKEKNKPLACVITYGCQQNENDSERICGMLEEMGYGFTDNREEAAVIIFNTCAVRENAEQKLMGNVGALKYLKSKKKKKLLIGVCGCMAQQPKASAMIRRKFRHVDMVFGTHSLHRFPEILLNAKKEAVMDVIDTDGYIVEDIPVRREDKNKAWVTVMYGCNNFCTYCIVPYVRGRERSRAPEDVLNEIRGLAKDGYKEVTLLGQNVNSYGKDLDGNYNFAWLLRQVNEIEGIERIRFATSHPKDISDELIDAMAECKKVCAQLHLPFQSGSSKVLKDMNRGYDKEKYLSIIDKVKAKIPDVVLSSDVIVGFPTETNEDFEETLDVIRKVGFGSLFTFIYSKRDGTKAATMTPVLSDEEIQNNFNRLLEVQNEISKRINDEYLGKTVEVFVDGYSETNPDVLQGRTDGNKVVNFKGPDEIIGTFKKVKITQTRTWSLGGELVD